MTYDVLEMESSSIDRLTQDAGKVFSEPYVAICHTAVRSSYGGRTERIKFYPRTKHSSTVSFLL